MMSFNNKVTLDNEQHTEMMAAVIAAGLLAYPECALRNENDVARYSLLAAREIVRQNREPKP